MEYRSRTPFGTTKKNLVRMLRPVVHITPCPDGIIFDRDVEVPVRDGTILRIDVARPETAGRYPVLMCGQPYGKGDYPAAGRSGFRTPFQYYVAANDAPITHSNQTSWEAPDPAFWVPRGYVVITVDLRGWGKSDGEGEVLSQQEGDDLHNVIEWASIQPWSNGKVGMSGVSYLAISQWMAAATRPPHLAAINPWEGFTDAYSDFSYPGGVRENGFMVLWSAIQRRRRPKSLSFRDEQKKRPLRDSWWAARSADLEHIEVPALVGASFTDQSLHTRGTFEGFRRIGSKQKWLYTHRGPKWSSYYDAEALQAQSRFFDHFLRGDDTGILEELPVRVEVRESRTDVVEVFHSAVWPPREVQPLVLHLDASDGALHRTRPTAPANVRVPRHGQRFVWAFDRQTDLIGPMRLRVRVSADLPDLTLFAGVRKMHEGREVTFEGSYGFTEDMVTRGWLRASHRAVDHAKSTDWEAWHAHDRTDPIPAEESVDLDLTLMPSATRFAAGDQLVLELRDHWFFPGNPVTGQWPAVYSHSPRQRWDIHTGGSSDASLTIPIRIE